jgi:hydroxymethylpyrimidine/phosphomethylpyrimidine kinase
VDADLLIAQAQAVLKDMDVACIKLGLLPSCDIIRAVHSVLGQASGIPVVLDPVLIAGGGFALSDSNTTALMRELLLPLVTVITPNNLPGKR